MEMDFDKDEEEGFDGNEDLGAGEEEKEECGVLGFSSGGVAMEVFSPARPLPLPSSQLQTPTFSSA